MSKSTLENASMIEELTHAHVGDQADYTSMPPDPTLEDLIIYWFNTLYLEALYTMMRE